MSLKAKLISSISMFVLVLALLVVSVFALRQERLSLGGTISFQASSVYAKVSGTVSGMNENPTLPTLIFSEGEDATPETDIEKWNALSLVFSESGEPIKISLTVENLSGELSLGVSITNQIASIENVNISITKGEEEATSAIVAPAESATFVLTISLKDTSVSVPETSYDFLINLTEASQMREINVYSNVEGTNVSGSGLYAIGDTVSITAPYGAHVDAFPLGIASDSNYENFVYKFGMEELLIEQNPPYEFVLTEDSPTDYYCFYVDFDSPRYKDTNTESPTYGFVFAYSGDFAIVVDGLRSEGQKLEKVTHLDFPNTVTIEGNQYKVIGATLVDGSPMAHYPNLESIYIPENFQLFVGVPISYGLTKLTEITVSPENNSFSDMGMNVLYDKVSKTVVAACSTSKIPEEATKIGYGAFISCENLTSITIPAGVTSIGAEAFNGCSGLTSVSLPSTLTSIGADAFYNCSSLKAFNGDGNEYYTINDGRALLVDGGKTLLAYAIGNTATSYTIPEGVTSIGDYAFSGCSSLTSITILEGVTSIGDYAFSGCSSLTSITIPERVTSIGSDAFSNCSSLTSITIPEGVKSIGYGAFQLCDSLATITINGNISTLDSSVFRDCSNLTKLTLGSNVTSLPDSLFGESYYNLTELTEIEVLGDLRSETFPSGTWVKDGGSEAVASFTGAGTYTRTDV